MRSWEDADSHSVRAINSFGSSRWEKIRVHRDIIRCGAETPLRKLGTHHLA
jgi:hypothetical protein